MYAEIQIGTLRKMIEFKIIEELDDEAIIGNKDLCQLETIIDFKCRRAELGKGNWIPMRIQQKEENFATLIKSIKIQPQSMVIVKAKVKHKNLNRIRLIKTSTLIRLKHRIYVQDGL